MTADNPSIRRSLELVERLQQVVAQFAKREERLTRGLETRRGGIAWRQEAATSGTEEDLAARLAEAWVPFKEEAAHVKGVADRRAARVRRVSLQGLRSLPRKAGEVRGNWLANLQMRQMQAEGSRTAALQAAEQEATRLAEALTESRPRLIQLKRETRRAFAGYRRFRKRLAQAGSEEGEGRIEDLERALLEAEARLVAFRKYLLPRIFRYAPPALLGGAGVLLGGALAYHWGFGVDGYTLGGGTAAAWLAGLAALHTVSQREASGAARALAKAVARADGLYEALRAHGTQVYDEALQGIHAEHERTHAEISGEWDRVDEIGTEYQVKTRAKIEGQTPRVLEKIRAQERRRGEEIATRREARLAEVREAFAAEQAEAMRKHEEEIAQWKEDEAGGWGKLAAEWRQAIDPIYAEIRAIRADGDRRFPEWSEEWIAQWKPPVEYPRGAKFADLEVDVKTLAGALPGMPGWRFRGRRSFRCRSCWPFRTRARSWSRRGNRTCPWGC